MANVAVRIDYKDAKSVLGGPSGPLYAAVRNQSEALRQRAVRYTPVNKIVGLGGQLRNSLTVEMSLVNGVPVGRVGAANDVKYAIWVHNGRGPIRARGKALRFEVPGGRIVYAKSVKGVKGRPFLTRAAGELFGTNFRDQNRGRVRNSA